AGVPATGGTEPPSPEDLADEAFDAAGGATDVPRPAPEEAPAPAAEPATRRPAAKRATSSAKRAGAGTAGAASKSPKKSL
ncbi:MAG TPA: transcriptional regulator, partial [Paraburkholderia sp.]